MPKSVMTVAHKGGTGKTLVAVNIALRLAEKYKVGLIDADFASPNLVEFLNLNGKITVEGDRWNLPTYKEMQVFAGPLLFGRKAVSMEAGQYAQFLRDAVQRSNWDDVDYLVADMPAGSGEEFKEMIRVFQEFLGSVIVTQPAHSMDAKNAITLHLDNEIPIVGLIENMSYMEVGKAKWPIFGQSAVDSLGEKFDVEVLGKIPLSMNIRKAVDAGKPFLKGKYGEAVDNAVQKIEKLKPQTPGFIEKIVEKGKNALQDILFNLILHINQDVPVRHLQEEWGYPGGRVVMVNLMNNKMTKARFTEYFMLVDGKMYGHENPGDWDVRLNIWPKALKWAFLGNRRLSDGTIYTLESAVRMGHITFQAEERASIDAVKFWRGVFSELEKDKELKRKLTPVLKLL